MNSIGGIGVDRIGVRQVIKRKRGWLSRKTRIWLLSTPDSLEEQQAFLPVTRCLSTIRYSASTT